MVRGETSDNFAECTPFLRLRLVAPRWRNSGVTPAGNRENNRLQSPWNPIIMLWNRMKPGRSTVRPTKKQRINKTDVNFLVKIKSDMISSVQCIHLTFCWYKQQPNINKQRRKNTISSSKSSTSSHFINFCQKTSFFGSTFFFWELQHRIKSCWNLPTLNFSEMSTFQGRNPGGEGWKWDARPCELTCHRHYQVTPLKFNSSPLKIDNPKRKGSSSNHHFSGASC